MDVWKLEKQYTLWGEEGWQEEAERLRLQMEKENQPLRILYLAQEAPEANEDSKACGVPEPAA